nr:RluA family pseudouridine synthase [Leptolyngbya sp. BC1307]
MPDRPAMNQGWTYADRVRTGGQTVLDYYTQRYQHSTREQWQARIEQGQILRDGLPVTAQAVLGRGQTLTYYRLPWQEPDAPLDFEVLYEDEDLWAIAKPSGLPVLPGGGYLEHTLLHQMRRHYPDDTPVPVHRLGRGTSGVMLFARSELARERLSRQFRERTISKIYRALIGPTDPAELAERSDRFTCTTPIGKLPHSQIGYIYGHSPTGLASHSECQILQRGPQSTLVEVSILTGRPHQIRIHLAAAGYPLLGDPLYPVGGVPDLNGSVMPGDCGYCLHAHRVRFTHPRLGKTLCVVAELPDGLRWTAVRNGYPHFSSAALLA